MAKTLKLITLELYEKLAAKISDRIKNIELTPGPKGDTGPQGPTGAKGNTGDRGPQGYTFTPKVDASGNLSWTNNGGLDNPSTVNIKGPQGEKGATGDRGPQGLQGATIEGMGPSTILRGNSIFCQVVGCDNFSMSNLSAECSAEQPFETFFHTVLLSNHIYTKGHYFRNLVIKNFKIGLHLYASDHNTIENCRIENCNTGIDVEYTSETRVLNNYIYNSDVGILIHNASHRNQISNNYIIRGTGTAGDYTTSQNTIQMSGGNYNDISNNYILGKNYVNSAGATNTFTNNRYQ